MFATTDRVEVPLPQESWGIIARVRDALAKRLVASANVCRICHMKTPHTKSNVENS
jgi:hypothetical protein